MKKWQDYELEFILQNYEKMGIRYCAEFLNRTNRSVQKKASTLNLKVDKETILSLRKTTVKKSWVNRNDSFNNLKKILNIPIENIKESPDFLYVLGYIWGDGHIHNGGISCVNSVSLEIVKEDGLDIYDKMNSVINWNISYRKRKNRKEKICFTINNRIFIEHLVSLNFNKKSFEYPSFIDDISYEMKRYFYLGLSDADGCFYFKKSSCYQYSISSTIDQNWKHMTNILDHLDIKYSIKKIEKIRKNGNINRHSVVVISNKIDVIKYGDYLYGADFIGLNRKYNKYLEIKNV
jgi:hypothetical protein